MEPTDFDKIADKLLVFRGRLPKYEDHGICYLNECTQELLRKIDELLELIDLYAQVPGV